MVRVQRFLRTETAVELRYQFSAGGHQIAASNEEGDIAGTVLVIYECLYLMCNNLLEYDDR